MSKRNTQQRRHLIVKMVQEQGEVSVETLAGFFETSEVTIRKDLTALEESGLLLRRYGGAVRIPSEMIEDSNEQLSKQKLAIANEAVKHIRDHNRIIIDSGSTTGAMVKALYQTGLVIMTNSLALATELTMLDNEPTVLMTGGTWDTRSDSFQGKVAEQVLRSYDFDQLFIGADGLDLARGTTTFNELVGLSQVMAEVSREVIVLIESQKIGRKMPNLELEWQGVNKLITDAGIDEEIKKTIESHGVEVILARD
ncbi:DeoR family transcriptional regulator [Actinobacillus equuli subsp. haemolyticus]|uniref:DeoR/GlpR family DNA-binding transcription regulator n=1 Tax=Actinobacillus equuli TaxID=718 RepID=UPI0024410514|nr:DeoR family transcriptional regulator [Actinobacillus equuli]WGE50499.1 DeoR family transcriptional regulator [Actinobacillus equuli subsp. haemolyticus]WGE62925.1 DeoR family transcriptional regulator [Actinobacillus equuli subsp. haemolyticus]WGE67315.1 DeoR family transcriptional regulator [Actinobacillus equuli subsp. haemolyticus]WGE69119.1 DeoR family transcriptional regulator [Actinobacillus equuli subsp. haemolyticus]WGE75145.1 DeoR family transcriptional regulator [Actinobacillus e